MINRNFGLFIRKILEICFPLDPFQPFHISDFSCFVREVIACDGFDLIIVPINKWIKWKKQLEARYFWK